MKIIGTSRTDVGKLRTENQDFYGFWPERDLYFVCDGMGGGAAGDFASKMAVEVIDKAYDVLNKDSICSLIGNKNADIDEKLLKPIACLKLANRQLCNLQAKYLKLKGMGTTAVGAFFEKEKALLHIYNVGDSRIYRIRNGNIKQLTEDHSKIQELLSKGKMTQADAKTAEFQSMITRALGTANSLKVDYKAEVVKNEDIYVFCSDGLNGELDDAHIRDIVCLNKSDLNEIASELVLAANNAGGRDNTTVIILKVVDDGKPAEVPADYQEQILLFDEETKEEISNENSVIKNIEKKITLQVPKQARMGKLYTNPFLLAVCLVILILFGIFFFSKMSHENKKDIAELTGSISGIKLSIKTITEENFALIMAELDKISKMQMIQDIIANNDNLSVLSDVGINIVSVSDGKEAYSGSSSSEPLEIDLANGKYKVTLTYSGYKVLDEKNMNLTDFIEIQTQNSTNLTNTDVIMVPEMIFGDNENSETEIEDTESTENSETENENTESIENEENIDN